jgi:quinone-modifying oxidoreductase subunit QmoC
MAVQADPRLVAELETYGAQDVLKCYHCGNCTAVCPFSKEPFIFPRKSMRYLQMGLREKLKANLEPWLCYYCGECSEQCPREAEPGETMMSMRRWLTAQYDFTGISHLLYRSWYAELAGILLLAAMTGLGFYLFGARGGDIRVYDGPGAFLPASAIHAFDWTMASILGSLLLVNCVRMWWITMGRDPRLRGTPGIYLHRAGTLLLHFFTQKRYSECDRKGPWRLHIVLMLSYVTMLVLIMFFLPTVQAGPRVDWRAHVLGYAATAGLLATVAMALVGRIRKSATHYKHSHETDWIFLIMLFYVALTGIVQHGLHRLGHPYAANVVYLAHLMGVVPMLVLEVPFSKWAHMCYRPLAMYFSRVQMDVLEAREQDPVAGKQLA